METLILLEKYFLLFIIYSVGGWIVEEVVCSISEKKIVDRGFLIGPVCPIYGFGGLGMTIFLTKFMANPVTLFCMAVIISAVLEYFTSYIMEKIFNARWWDYSEKKFNLNGRVCLSNLIPFGIFGLILIYVINPFLFKVLNNLPIVALNILAYSNAVILLLDFVVSMAVVTKVTITTKKIASNNPKDDTDEITAKVKEELRSTVTGNRLVEAFPEFTTLTTRIKAIAEKTAEKGKKVVNESKKKVEDTAKKGKKAVINTAQKGKVAVENKLKGKS